MPTDNPTPAQLFAAALAYLDERIAWLQQERRDLIETEARRVAVERRDPRADDVTP